MVPDRPVKWGSAVSPQLHRQIIVNTEKDLLMWPYWEDDKELQ